MEIRNYHSQDRSSVVALWDCVFPNSAGHNDPGTAIDRKVAVRDELFFVAIEEESIVGAILAGYDGHRGWIYSLAVDPRYRRRGIGTKLVRHAEKALRRLGCPKVNLQIRAENGAVVSFYKSLGFLPEERISMGKLLSE